MQDKKITSLVQKAQAHDPEAFTEVMQLCMKDMYRTSIAILKHDEDAADAIQDTILICWEKIWTLREPGLFKTWMTRILINKCLDIRKWKERVADISECPMMFTTDEKNLEWKEALQVLDEKYRLPIILYYGQGYKIRERAQILCVPVSTVQTRLSRGRRQLARYYKEEEK